MTSSISPKSSQHIGSFNFFHNFCRSLGYIVKDGGEVEQQDKFLRRMSGFVRLYAAITISSAPSSQRPNHPHGVNAAWSWLARIANVEPRPDVTATVIGDLLSVAGRELHRTYGRQFIKVIKLIADEYLPLIKAVTPSGSGGPITRLEGLLRDALSGRLPSPPRSTDWR